LRLNFFSVPVPVVEPPLLKYRYRYPGRCASEHALQSSIHDSEIASISASRSKAHQNDDKCECVGSSVANHDDDTIPGESTGKLTATKTRENSPERNPCKKFSVLSTIQCRLLYSQMLRCMHCHAHNVYTSACSADVYTSACLAAAMNVSSVNWITVLAGEGRFGCPAHRALAL